MENDFKLTIELVPKTCFYSNVRSEVEKDIWDIIRKKAYKLAKNKCEICNGIGDKWNVECHEIWFYDDKNHNQILKGFIALCPTCHKVKHAGLANLKGEIDIVVNQISNINNISKKESKDYITSSFDVWKKRSKFKWNLDISYIEKYLNNTEI